VYVGRGLDTRLPSPASEVASMKRADAAVFAGAGDVSRRRQRDALRSGTVVGFVGDRAEDELVATLGGVTPDEAAEQVGSGVGKADDLDRSWGIEYAGDSDVTLAFVRGSAVDTHLYGYGQGTDGLTRSLKRTMTRREQYDAATSSDLTTTATCASGWDCLGESHAEGNKQPYGAYEKWVKARYAQDDDPNNGYFSWRADQSATPGVAYDSWDSNYENTELFRVMNFPDHDELRKHGPDSTEGSTTVGVSVGLDAGTSGISGGINWSWSRSVPDVTISETIDFTEERAEHRWDINSGAPRTSTYTASPGYQVQVDESETSASYKFDSRWTWSDLWDEWTYKRYGDGEWNA
jgi:hypothetical protein